MRAGQFLGLGFLFFGLLLVSLRQAESLPNLYLELFVGLSPFQICFELLLFFIALFLEEITKVLGQLMGGIVSAGEHEAVEQLSYGEGVSLNEFCAGAVDIGGVLADCDEGVDVDLEPVEQLDDQVARHDLC